jgi:hypothetical protein
LPSPRKRQYFSSSELFILLSFTKTTVPESPGK